jgi:hypothetical protein
VVNLISSYFTRFVSSLSYLSISLILMGCIQFSEPDRAPSSKAPVPVKKNVSLAPGTVNLESKKEIDLSSYFDKDFDRLILSDERGSVSNLSRKTALRSKNIWFSAGGKTTVRLVKSGVVVFEESL